MAGIKYGNKEDLYVGYLTRKENILSLQSIWRRSVKECMFLNDSLNFICLRRKNLRRDEKEMKLTVCKDLLRLLN